MNKSLQLYAKVWDELGNELTDRYVEWQSSNPRVASVGRLTGLVKGVSRGTVTITATSEGKSDKVVVTVLSPPPPAKTHSTGFLNIKQTWTADLDEGLVGDSAKADIWFQAATATERYVTPRNGAKIAIVGTTSVGRDGCAAASLSTSRININDLPAGTYVCVLTNQGRYSQFRVNATVGPSPGTLSIGYTTWD